MTNRTMVKERGRGDLGLSNLDMKQNIENLFRDMSQTSQYPLAIQEPIRDMGGYTWHSNVNRKEAGKHLACSFIGAERNWLAQAEERLFRCLKVYDTDRIDKAVSEATAFYPYAKLFGVAKDTEAPIIIKGDKHIWEGKRLSELQRLSREDQLVPCEVMKRVYDIEHSGSGFKDGYALFWPHQAYEISKKNILKGQVESLKDDGRKILFLAKTGAALIKEKISSAHNSIAQVKAHVRRVMVGAEGFANGVNEEMSQIDLTDPVLAGIIVGSLKDKRLFFIEIGRWE